MDRVLNEHLRNQAVVDRLFTEVLNAGALEVLPELYSQNVVDQNPLPGGPPGLAGVRYSISSMRRAFPDCEYTIRRVTSEGDTVLVRAAFRGTQTGRLLFRRGNGRSVSSTTDIAFRIADGRIIERWVVRDQPQASDGVEGSHGRPPATLRLVDRALRSRMFARSAPARSIRGEPFEPIGRQKMLYDDSKTRLKALVIGGGIGGLATAVALRHVGLEVTVFERAQAARSGAGIHLWSNAILALDEIGLGEAVRAAAPAQRAVEFSNAQGDVLASWRVGDYVQKFGAPVVAIERAELSSILLAALPEGVVRVGAECTGFVEDANGVSAVFADGSSERGDLLIGADGLRSTIRQQLLGEELPRYSGYTAWRAVAEISHEKIGPGNLPLLLRTG